MMPSATDFLPSYIRLFMNFASTMSPYLASGVTSRFSARWRRDIVGSFVFFLLDPGSPPDHVRGFGGGDRYPVTSAFFLRRRSGVVCGPLPPWCPGRRAGC